LSAFLARNVTLVTANGEFVINWDSSGWEHPHKLVATVAELP
jgi:hypothetical protein